MQVNELKVLKKILAHCPSICCTLIMRSNQGNLR